jgi:hypothetical protein
MRTEIITKRDDLTIRRLPLEPGEAMPWCTDSCNRFTVVVRDKQLRIKFRDTDKHILVPVYSSMADWDKPDPRLHCAVNVGTSPYEEVIIFFDASGADPNGNLCKQGAGYLTKCCNKLYKVWLLNLGIVPEGRDQVLCL